MTSLGRSSSNDIVIDIPEVSRRHARIQFENGRFQIFDLNSTNGTKVNGRRVGSAIISDKDIITLGTARLEIIPYRSSVGRK
jgi:pSer/pThr/pTyr-binding forkhead associated (FHA) protein